MSVFTMSYSMAQIVSTKTGMEIIAKYGYRANWIFLFVLGLIGFILSYRLVFIVKKEKKIVKQKIVQSIFVARPK